MILNLSRKRTGYVNNATETHVSRKTRPSSKPRNSEISLKIKQKTRMKRINSSSTKMTQQPPQSAKKILKTVSLQSK